MMRKQKPFIKHIILAVVLFPLFTTPSVYPAIFKAGDFDGDRAYEHLRRQVDSGPRIAGERGHKDTLNYITNHLKQAGWEVRTQTFTQEVPLLQRTMEFTNIIGIRNAAAPEKVLLGAHWDTRPIAEKDSDPALRTQPIPGANDGASGVAVLLELATAIQETPTSLGVCLVFFDGEDYGLSGSASEFCYGSKYFAKNIPDECRKIRAGVVLDMIGDRDLVLFREGISLRKYPELVNDIWKIGTEKYPDVFFWSRGPEIYDDHVPLQEAGIPAIDIIDFDYPPWHTSGDNVYQCSPRSLQVVGDVILHWLMSISVK